MYKKDPSTDGHWGLLEESEEAGVGVQIVTDILHLQARVDRSANSGLTNTGASHMAQELPDPNIMPQAVVRVKWTRKSPSA